MSKVIWKYQLPIDGGSLIVRERVIEVLHVGAQCGWPTIWLLVDNEEQNGPATEITAWGTGWPMPDEIYRESVYWGTCEDGAGYVWHYFAKRVSEQEDVVWMDVEGEQYEKLLQTLEGICEAARETSLNVCIQ